MFPTSQNIFYHRTKVLKVIRPSSPVFLDFASVLLWNVILGLRVTQWDSRACNGDLGASRGLTVTQWDSRACNGDFGVSRGLTVTHEPVMGFSMSHEDSL